MPPLGWRKPAVPCLAEGCNEAAVAMRHCSRHYQRLKDRGTTESRKNDRGDERDRFWRFVDKRADDECWLWTGTGTPQGYGHFIRANKEIWRAHRFSYEMSRGPIPHGYAVLHKCDNPRCVNPEHLSVGTIQDNNADKIAKGRQARGERLHSAKLSEDQVVKIRRDTRPHRVIARDYGIGKSTVGSVKCGITWKHIT